MVAPELDSWLATTLPLDQVVYGAWVTDDGRRSWQGHVHPRRLRTRPAGGVAGPAVRTGAGVRAARRPVGLAATPGRGRRRPGGDGRDRRRRRRGGRDRTGSRCACSSRRRRACRAACVAAGPRIRPTWPIPRRRRRTGANIMVARAARLRVAAAVAADRVRAALASSATLVDDTGHAGRVACPGRHPVAGLVDVTTPRVTTRTGRRCSARPGPHYPQWMNDSRPRRHWPATTSRPPWPGPAPVAGRHRAPAVRAGQPVGPGAVGAALPGPPRWRRRGAGLARPGRTGARTGRHGLPPRSTSSRATGARRFDPVLVQLPDHAEEPWGGHRLAARSTPGPGPACWR